MPLWFVFGILGAWIATSKGRGGRVWFLLCSLLEPIGLLVTRPVSARSQGYFNWLSLLPRRL